MANALIYDGLVKHPPIITDENGEKVKDETDKGSKYVPSDETGKTTTATQVTDGDEKKTKVEQKTDNGTKVIGKITKPGEVNAEKGKLNSKYEDPDYLYSHVFQAPKLEEADYDSRIKAEEKRQKAINYANAIKTATQSLVGAFSGSPSSVAKDELTPLTQAELRRLRDAKILNAQKVAAANLQNEVNARINALKEAIANRKYNLTTDMKAALANAKNLNEYNKILADIAKKMWDRDIKERDLANKEARTRSLAELGKAKADYYKSYTPGSRKSKYKLNIDGNIKEYDVRDMATIGTKVLNEMKDFTPDEMKALPPYIQSLLWDNNISQQDLVNIALWKYGADLTSGAGSTIFDQVESSEKTIWE